MSSSAGKGSPAPTSPSLELYAVVRYSHVAELYAVGRYSHVADLSSGPRGRLEAHVASTFLTEPSPQPHVTGFPTCDGCRLQNGKSDPNTQS